MLKNFRFVACFLLLFAVDAFSNQSIQESSRKLESWYHATSVGFIARAEVDGEPFHSSLLFGVDFLRFYFRANGHFLIGPGITYSTHGSDSGLDVTLQMYFFSLSAQYYLKSIGDGFFLRGDLGLGWASIGDDYGNFAPDSGVGPGFQVGAGWAFPLSRETSLLVYTMYRRFRADSVPFADVILHVGWLW